MWRSVVVVICFNPAYSPYPTLTKLYNGTRISISQEELLNPPSPPHHPPPSSLNPPSPLCPSPPTPSQEELLKRPKGKDKTTLKKLEDLEGGHARLVEDNLVLSTAVTTAKQEIGGCVCVCLWMCVCHPHPSPTLI